MTIRYYGSEFASERGMSAVTQTADRLHGGRHFGFVPGGDISTGAAAERWRQSSFRCAG
jgi:hypothetical protein